MSFLWSCASCFSLMTSLLMCSSVCSSLWKSSSILPLSDVVCWWKDNKSFARNVFQCVCRPISPAFADTFLSETCSNVGDSFVQRTSFINDGLVSIMHWVSGACSKRVRSVAPVRTIYPRERERVLATTDNTRVSFLTTGRYYCIYVVVKQGQKTKLLYLK